MIAVCLSHTGQTSRRIHMAEVLLFHHAHGRTPGVVTSADELRRVGHTVHVPHLYEGRTFDDLEAGVGYAQEVGFSLQRLCLGHPR
jgi:hypothetical protein